MKSFTKVLAAMMLMTAMLFAVGCKKDNGEESGGGNGGGNDTSFNINAMANPADGGTVTGSGTYEQGDECTLTATANYYYVFMCWTENDEVVSDEARYTFLVTRDRTLKANFIYDETYVSIINAVAYPTEGGIVEGSGIYEQGTECTLTATANAGYVFEYWTKNGEVVSTDANYTFTVNANETLAANFAYDGGDGHTYVDLSLPSGLLWAACNVCAENPEDYGYYYQWDQAKIAAAHWGNGWRLPTKEEFEELYNNTAVTWTTCNGVNGRLFTSYGSNSLFLPASGFSHGNTTMPAFDAGIVGHYWSSSIDGTYANNSYYFYFNNDYYYLTSSLKGIGCSVRPVRSGQN